MSEMTVAFDDMQKTLAPFFAGKTVRIVFDNSSAQIFVQKPSVDDITLASENVLAKDWLSPEEDLAWADL